jgi:predicted O-methyltransferase YrrM
MAYPPGAISTALRFPQARRWARRTFDAFKFDLAMRRFMADPEAAVKTGSSVLADLINGWGNTGWSAMDEYLRVGVDHVFRSGGAVLECGTGLSTLLFGAIAQQRGIEYWALEHLPEWTKTLERQLARYDVSVHLCTKPLRSYAGFEWYDPPLSEMPPQFCLVVCDGPPSRTAGGRYGLVPVMHKRLQPGCIVLLDDAERAHERQVARRWQSELPADAEFLDGVKPLIRLKVRP